jgi:hypothetical protein
MGRRVEVCGESEILKKGRGLSGLFFFLGSFLEGGVGREWR